MSDKNSHIFKHFSESPSCKCLYTPSQPTISLILNLKKPYILTRISPTSINKFITFILFSFITSVKLLVMHTSLLLIIYSLTRLQLIYCNSFILLNWHKHAETCLSKMLLYLFELYLFCYYQDLL